MYKYEGYEIRWSRVQPLCLEIGVGENKGALPKVLDQFYTNTIFAKRAIDNYLLSKPKKEVKSGEATAESGVK